MAYTNDNLNSEELAELYNSSAKNIMFPENPVGNFIYQMYGHLEEDNLLFKSANANNIFLCDDTDLSKIGERYGIIKPTEYTNFEYRLLIALGTFPVVYKAIMEKVLKNLFHDEVTNTEDMYISTSSSNFKYSSIDKTNSRMSNKDSLKDVMSTKTENFIIFLPDSVDKTSLCNVLKDLDLPYVVDGGCSDPVIDIILLPTTEDYYNYVFYPDNIYDVSNLDDNYSIELGSPDSTKLNIVDGSLVIDVDTYNRVNLINNHQFFVTGEYSGIVFKKLSPILDNKYLEFTGRTQYINTNHIPSTSTEIEISFEYTGTANSYWRIMFGTGNISIWGVQSQSQRYGGQYMTPTGSDNLVDNISLNAKHKIKLKKENNNANIYFNDTLVSSRSDTTNPSQYPIFIGNRNNNGNPVNSQYWEGKIYRFKVWENSELFMDLYPINENETITISSGTFTATSSGFINLMNGELFYNKGSGNLTVGYK